MSKMIKRRALAPVSTYAYSRYVKDPKLADALASAMRIAAHWNCCGGQWMTVHTRAERDGSRWRVTATVRSTSSDFIMFKLSWG